MGQLDVYELKSDIFHDFLKRLPSFEGILVAYWLPIFFYTHSSTAPEENRYVQLGYYLNVSVPREICENYMYTDSPTNWILDLLPGITPRYLKQIPRRAKFNPDFLLEICYNKPTDLSRLPKDVKRNLALAKAILKATANQDLGNWRIDESCSPRTIDYAILYHPRALAIRMTGLKERARQLLTDREKVLRFVKTRPLFLDMFPEYWKDREVCLTALEPNLDLYFSDVYMNPIFLQECVDRVVIAKALEVYPETITTIPSEFRTVTAIKESFDRTKLEKIPYLYENLLYSDGMRTSDPEILGRCMDSGMFGLSNPNNPPNTFAKWRPGKLYKKKMMIQKSMRLTSHPNVGLWAEPKFKISSEVLNDLCGNYHWMMERIENRPESWRYASPELKENRDLLMLALKISAIYKDGTYSGSPLKLLMKEVPECFDGDKELMLAISNVCGLSAVPVKSQTAEMAVNYANNDDDFADCSYNFGSTREVYVAMLDGSRVL